MSGHYAWIGCEADVEQMHVFQRRDIVPGGVCRLRVVVVRLKSSDVGSSNPGRGPSFNDSPAISKLPVLRNAASPAFQSLEIPH